MKRITVYSASELKARHPEGFDHALEHWRDHQEEIFWGAEIVDSLKALFNKAGIKITDWSIGPYDRSFVRFDPPEYLVDYGETDGYEDASELAGNKARAWIKANILDGATFKRVTYDKRKGGKGWRYDLMRKDGKPWSCEFTGYCADDDYIDDLLEAIRKGETLADALHGLADTARRLLEQEAEDQASEEYFTDFADANNYQFTASGRMI